MSNAEPPTLWQRWVRRPQEVWLRKAVFQIHLWSGVSLGLYIFFISVTGGVLVYRNELYVAATPEPIISTSTAPRLDDDELTEAALRSYPGYRVERIVRPTNRDEAVQISLIRGEETRKRLFDPRTGADVGSAAKVGIAMVEKLIEVHADLLGGDTGRKVNGIGAVAVFVSAITGLVIWWPGAQRWRRSLTLRRGVGWKRFNWDLHSVVGFWSFAFIVVFAASGLYLCIQRQHHDYRRL